MRHRISGNSLNRFSSFRKATLRDMAKATLIQERIFTTKVKAKEARKLVDKLITLGKRGTLADKRRAFAILCDHKLVSELFNNTAPRFKNRAGGYTRLIPIGNRRGDNAEMTYLELTEKSKVVVSEPKSTAAAKKDSLSAKAEDADTSSESTSTTKDPASKKDVVKDQAHQTIHKDKGSSKRIVSGIRKMFNKKSSGK